MEEYKPNSHKSKEEQQTAPPEKKVEKVVSGSVKSRKKSEIQKFADVFIQEDAQKVKSYILMDVLVPAVKKDQDPSGPGCGHADSRGRKRWGDRDGMRVFRGQLFQQGVQKAYGHDALGVSGVCEAGGVFEDADISCESLFQKPSE